MPSYKKLAVFALAASTVSPALAAPTRYEKLRFGLRGGVPDGFHSSRESQIQARADLQARISGELLKNIATQFGLAAIPTALLSMLSGPKPAKRTTETSEGQSIAEMEGRALGDYKLDRWVKSLKDVCLRSLKMRS
jgi:hypothetical protein